MNQPIEGDAPKIDLRTREGRAMRAGIRSDTFEPETDIRRDTRPDSVREAELRAREIEASGTLSYGNELDIPANLAPPGWEYQLKAEEIALKPNSHHITALQRNGWRAVPADRHPDKLPGHEGVVRIKGLILMEIPKVIAEKRRAQERHEARELQANADAKLFDAPPNTGPRQTKSAHHQSINSIEHDWETPAPAPKRA